MKPLEKIPIITRISNSVTHLRSSTNTAITGNAEPSARNDASSADIPARNRECSHVSRVFYDALQMFENI